MKTKLFLALIPVVLVACSREIVIEDEGSGGGDESSTTASTSSSTSTSATSSTTGGAWGCIIDLGDCAPNYEYTPGVVCNTALPRTRENQGACDASGNCCRDWSK